MTDFSEVQDLDDEFGCTGCAASWCPICGDCICPGDDFQIRIEEDPDCPLHGLKSMHGDAAITMAIIGTDYLERFFRGREPEHRRRVFDKLEELGVLGGFTRARLDVRLSWIDLREALGTAGRSSLRMVKEIGPRLRRRRERNHEPKVDGP